MFLILKIFYNIYLTFLLSLFNMIFKLKGGDEMIKELNYSPDKLNDLIYQKSINVSALSKKLDTYYIYIHNIQKNVRQPSLDMAVKLARYFDMSVEELFYEK